MRLADAEKETIIRFNDAEKVAYISTCNETWLREMKRLWGEGEKMGAGPYYQWEIPKERVKLPVPKSEAKMARGKALGIASATKFTKKITVP